MARTGIQLHSATLKELRESRTQEEMGIAIRESCGQKFDSKKHDALAFKRAALTTYQRIERTGKTSPKTAQTLADYFHVSLKALMGEEPIDGMERVIGTLNKQHESGHNVKFNYEYAKTLTSRPWEVKEGDPLPPHQIKPKWRLQFASAIGMRIETAQWHLNPSELSALASITGVSEGDLLKPVYVRDFWWATSSFEQNRIGQVVSGNPSSLISDVFKQHPQFSHDITTIHLSKKSYAYRFDLTIFDPKTKEQYLPQWLEFTPCTPDKDNGIRWLTPNPRKHDQHKKWCAEVALRHAHSVYDFDGEHLPKGADCNTNAPVLARKEHQQ